MIIFSKLFNKKMKAEIETRFCMRTKRFFRLCDHQNMKLIYIERHVPCLPSDADFYQELEWYAILRVNVNDRSEVIPFPVFCELVYGSNKQNILLEIKKMFIDEKGFETNINE